MSRQFLLVIFVCSLVGFMVPSCSDNSSAPAGGGGGITEEQAIDLVKNTIIPAVTDQNDKYICVKSGGTVAKGGTVEEAAPADWSSARVPSSGASIAVDAESYFFFLDLDPRSFYEHPVKYILVNKSSGSYDVSDANWWPKINGSTPAQFLQMIPDSQYVVDDKANLSNPAEETMAFPIPTLDLTWEEGFIVVQGLMPDEKLYSVSVSTCQDVLNFFNAYKNVFSRAELLADVQADNFGAVIDDMVSDGIDLITLYILAHGNVNRIGLSGHAVYASTVRNKMAEHPGTLFNFMLGSCHGGSFIDDLQTLDNVRVVMTATSAELNAWPDWDSAEGLSDYNPMDSGSEWTSSILSAAVTITTNPDLFSIVEDWAGTYGIPKTCELLYQMHKGAVGENTGMNLYYNLDLSSRTGDAAPQLYYSWTRVR